MAMGCGGGERVVRVLEKIPSDWGGENQEKFCKGGEKFDIQKQEQQRQ